MFLLFLVAVPTFSQSLPDSPSPKVFDKKFAAVLSVLAASNAADYVTSVQMLDRGWSEQNPIFATSHPSPGRYAAVGGATFAGEVFLAYELKKLGQRHRWARWLWIVEPSEAIGEHTVFAAHNASLGRRKP